MTLAERRCFGPDKWADDYRRGEFFARSQEDAELILSHCHWTLKAMLESASDLDYAYIMHGLAILRAVARIMQGEPRSSGVVAAFQERYEPL